MEAIEKLLEDLQKDKKEAASQISLLERAQTLTEGGILALQLLQTRLKEEEKEN